MDRELLKEQMPPKTHDLAYLCTLCSKHDYKFEDILTQCSYLTDFGVQPRYPKEMGITDATIEQAVKYALERRDFAAIKMLREVLKNDEEK